MSRVNKKALLAAVIFAAVFIAAVLYFYQNKETNKMTNNTQNQGAEIELPKLDNNLTEIRKTILKEGNGREIKQGDVAYVIYAGFLPNGEVFDSNVNTGQAIGLPIGEGVVIKGWDEGLLGIKEGTEVILDVPANKAYGEQGVPGRIPANSALRFDVLVVKVLSKEEAQKAAEQQKAQDGNESEAENSDK